MMWTMFPQFFSFGPGCLMKDILFHTTNLYFLRLSEVHISFWYSFRPEKIQPFHCQIFERKTQSLIMAWYNHHSSINWYPTWLRTRWYYIHISKNINPRASEIDLISTILAGVKDHLVSSNTLRVKSYDDDPSIRSTMTKKHFTWKGSRQHGSGCPWIHSNNFNRYSYCR